MRVDRSHRKDVQPPTDNRTPTTACWGHEWQILKSPKRSMPVATVFVEAGASRAILALRAREFRQNSVQLRRAQICHARTQAAAGGSGPTRGRKNNIMERGGSPRAAAQTAGSPGGWSRNSSLQDELSTCVEQRLRCAQVSGHASGHATSPNDNTRCASCVCLGDARIASASLGDDGDGRSAARARWTARERARPAAAGRAWHLRRGKAQARCAPSRRATAWRPRRQVADACRQCEMSWSHRAAHGQRRSVTALVGPSRRATGVAKHRPPCDRARAPPPCFSLAAGGEGPSAGRGLRGKEPASTPQTEGPEQKEAAGQRPVWTHAVPHMQPVRLDCARGPSANTFPRACAHRVVIVRRPRMELPALFPRAPQERAPTRRSPQAAARPIGRPSLTPCPPSAVQCPPQSGPPTVACRAERSTATVHRRPRLLHSRGHQVHSP